MIQKEGLETLELAREITLRDDFSVGDVYKIFNELATKYENVTNVPILNDIKILTYKIRRAKGHHPELLAFAVSDLYFHYIINRRDLV